MLHPGMRVRIKQRLLGEELYGVDDPPELQKWCGKEVTVARVINPSNWMVDIEEDRHAGFYMEEIECIVEDEDVEITESDESIGILFGGAI